MISPKFSPAVNLLIVWRRTAFWIISFKTVFSELIKWGEFVEHIVVDFQFSRDRLLRILYLCVVKHLCLFCDAVCPNWKWVGCINIRTELDTTPLKHHFQNAEALPPLLWPRECSVTLLSVTWGQIAERDLAIEWQGRDCYVRTQVRVGLQVAEFSVETADQVITGSTACCGSIWLPDC